MRVLLGVLAFAAVIAGEDGGAGGILRGTLLERDDTPAGDLAIRGADNRVTRLRFDAKTYAEREGRRVAIRDLRPGEQVEIVADQGRRPAERYARIIRAGELPSNPRVTRRRYRPDRSHQPYQPAFDDLFPRGDLTFSGTISQLGGGTLVLRTRASGPTRILLRDDTRYLQNGQQAALRDLAVNTRVFVRAGKTVDGDIEAFQVIWGGILKPGSQE